ncbi:MAG: preprotein translocase subunit YajC [Bacteroidales bacterium]
MNFLNVMLMAGGTNAGSGNSGTMSIVMILAIIVIFYFFMIRPQSKRQKEERKFREQLSKGDQVMTISGMHGKIKEIKDTTVMLEIAYDVVIEIEKSSIAMNTAQNNASIGKK